MHVALIYPNLPPKLDGIGDFTGGLAEVLSQKYKVTVLVGEGDFDKSNSFAIHPLYSTKDTATFNKLYDWVKTEKPEVLLIQYNPFSYGHRGYNPHFHRVVRKIRKELPFVRLVLMAHEAYVTTENVRTAIMAAWQKKQFRSLVGSVHWVLSTSEVWAQRIKDDYSPEAVGPFYVSSNIPHANLTREEAKSQLGIKPEQLVLGFFGTAHPSRPLSWVAGAVRDIRAAGHDAILLYAGPHGDALRNAFAAAGVDAAYLRDEGKLPPLEVSRAFSAMDIYICPFDDGASTRRTTLITGMQHGIATVSTDGRNTSDFLRSQNGSSMVLTSVDDEAAFRAAAVALAANTEERERLGAEVNTLYLTYFDWPVIAGRLMDVILTGK